MQPNFRLYREAYDAAIKAKDEFAARFYLNLFPPPERALIRAEPIVAPLFARLLLRDDVLAALQAQPAADPEIQAACLKLAGTWPESAEEYNDAGWALVLRSWAAGSGLPARPAPGQGRLPARAWRMHGSAIPWVWPCTVAAFSAEALATLTRSNELKHQREPTDLAILALTQHRLGQFDKARDTLGRLRKA